jgi:hypothetical protein
MCQRRPLRCRCCRPETQRHRADAVASLCVESVDKSVNPAFVVSIRNCGPDGDGDLVAAHRACGLDEDGDVDPEVFAARDDRGVAAGDSPLP